MRIRTLKQLRETGDTIVEVLIAIAVVSLVLSQTYASANRSLRLIQDNQERSESQRIVEGQIELLRLRAITVPDDIFGATAPTYFCMNGTGVITNTDFSNVPANFNNDAFDHYPDTCKNLGAGQRYNVYITRSSTDPTIFIFNSRWDSLLGHKNQVQMVYRISKAIAPIIPPIGECSVGRHLDNTNIVSSTDFNSPITNPTVAAFTVPAPAQLGTNPAIWKLYNHQNGNSFYSQAIYRGTNLWPNDDDDRNTFAIIKGSIQLPSSIIDQVPFPGDGNIPATDYWMYSNGNSMIGHAEYVIWGRNITGLTPGQEYVFYVYMSNAGDNTILGDPADPVIRLRMGGNPYDSSGTILNTITLTENATSNASPNKGWVRFAQKFTGPATGTTALKITDLASSQIGDDFAVAAIGIARCAPN